MTVYYCLVSFFDPYPYWAFLYNHPENPNNQEYISHGLRVEYQYPESQIRWRTIICNGRSFNLTFQYFSGIFINWTELCVLKSSYMVHIGQHGLKSDPDMIGADLIKRTKGTQMANLRYPDFLCLVSWSVYNIIIHYITTN